MRDEGKLLVTYGHDGPWDLNDTTDENRFTMEAWGARMELRAIQRRNRNATVKTRAAGRPKGKPSYGFRYVRVVMGGKIDHVELHPEGLHRDEADVAQGAEVDEWVAIDGDDVGTLSFRELSGAGDAQGLCGVGRPGRGSWRC